MTTPTAGGKITRDAVLAAALTSSTATVPTRCPCGAWPVP
jgi:hypothetical protein